MNVKGNHDGGTYPTRMKPNSKGGVEAGTCRGKLDLAKRKMVHQNGSDIGCSQPLDPLFYGFKNIGNFKGLLYKFPNA